MTLTLILTAALWIGSDAVAGAQVQPEAPRSTTERPNMSAPGLEQTLSGVLMDAACSAIADGRSDLTRTPRILPPRNTADLPARPTEPSAGERSVSEDSVPDKYRDCRVKSSTTSFAIYANGRIYMLDRVSNQMMQEHMLKAGPAARHTKSSEWITRTVVGTATSDDVLTLRSIRK
jgi:hypothetical protein